MLKINALTKALEKVKIKAPEALPLEEWETWRQEQKKAHPVIYFLQYTVWDKIVSLYEDAFRILWIDPIYAIKYRTTHKYNILDTGLKPGYYDFDTRIINGLFNELVNFVECEKAWMNVVWGKNSGKRGLFGKFRSRELGIDYLQWEISLKDDPNGIHGEEQSNAAKEILELYKWWTEVYLKRPDPMNVSGWSEYCNTHKEALFRKNRSDEEKEIEKSLLNKIDEIEVAYLKEDEEMLIRLIKVRKSLWT